MVPSRWHRSHSHHDGGGAVYIDTYSEPSYGCCTYGDGYAPPPPPELPPATYASYPYAAKGAPYLLQPELQVASTSAELDAHLYAEHTAGQPFAAQLTLDAGFMSGIGQSTLGARILMPGRFELGARNAILWEPAQRDYSALGSADLGLRFFQTGAVMMRLTLGVAWFGQFGTLESGPEVGLGMDLFLGRPWVLSMEASSALIGEVITPRARIQLGYLFGRSEIFAGYQYLQVGSVGLSTPLLGTRIWL